MPQHTEQAIEEILSLQETVKNQNRQSSTVEFYLRDVDFDGAVYHGNVKISSKALHKINAALQIRDKFVSHKRHLEEQDWNSVKESLKRSMGNTKFYGKKITKEDGSEEIVKLYTEKPGQGLTDDANTKSSSNINFDFYFNNLIDILRGTPRDYLLRDRTYDLNNETVRLSFVDTESEFDVFNNGIDPWKIGFDMSFDVLNYSQSPFFERLVCTNGMVSTTHGFSANIQAKRFNASSINKQMEKLLNPEYSTFLDLIQKHAEIAKTHNVSLDEFYTYRNFFESRNHDQKYNHILAKFFSESEIYRAYGEALKAPSKLWLSTANSGRNMYDFFNDLTWIASHRDQSRISLEDARALQIVAGGMLLKEPDLSKVAPAVSISVPPVRPSK